MRIFQDVANHLLDLGKRNRLLNFKDKGLKGIYVLNKNIDEIYKSIVNSKEWTIPFIDRILERQKSMTLDSEESNVLNYNPLKVYDIMSPIIKSRQLICYKKGYKQLNVLNGLYKEYNFYINEKGINSLYLAFGFIKYVEDNNEYKAPLLLIPIKYIREIDCYKIKEESDDIILNPTLDYYFKTQYKILLPNILDEDEPLFDYFNRVVDYIPDDMEIIREASIGIFSFLKMNMYNDLINNEDEVLKNQNIQALLGNPQLGYHEYPDSKVFPVVNADSSQLNAIKDAANGKSFVLQGPPGSGKSQTITNIISTLIANGRSVLFVSEKLAALEVVYNNLKKSGLNEFAIEVHSSKANKAAFIEELYKTAVLPRYNIEQIGETIIESHEIQEQYLNEYINELHNIIDKEGVSLYELICEYFSLEPLNFKYKLSNSNEIYYKDLKDVLDLFNNYALLIEPIGYDYRVLDFYGFDKLSTDYLNYEASIELQKCIGYLDSIITIKNKVNNYLSYNNSEIKTFDELNKAFDFISIMSQQKYYSNAYFDNSYNSLLELVNKYEDTKNSLPINPLENYDSDILDVDVKAVLRKLRTYTSIFRIFNKDYRELKRDIISYRIKNTSFKNLIVELNAISQYMEGIEKLKILNRDINTYFEYEVDPIIVKQDLLLINDNLGFKTKINKNQCINYLVDAAISYQAYRNDYQFFDNVAKRFDLSIFNPYEASIDFVANKIKNIYLKKNYLVNYISLSNTIKKLNEKNLLELLHYCLDKEIELSKLANTFKKILLDNKIINYLDSYPLLNQYNCSEILNRESEFKSLDERIMNVNRDLIVSINSLKRPEDVLAPSSPFGILTKEANKLKRKKPIRLLLNEIFDFALDIKPIFLMSPLSVATYLPSKNDIFDCVIFDEASQIFAWDALGAIYRAKQCIIIGDSKQMPPSNFFGTSTEAEEDDYESNDTESILDMSSSAFSSSTLRWHYRSRSDELISFSNKNFYNENLIIIPQAKTHEVGFGIDFVYLPNGRYLQNQRINEIEANEICKLVFEHYQNSDRSLGVVAFSKVQADLISDLVENMLPRYPHLHKYFTNEVEEPFFVKNLETVQGDERDRIIFSICYGYNEENKFYQRFGPLNNLGGERRLNVAITRAKYNITIVSSIRHTDIKIENTNSVGVKLLKNYLEYAENVVLKSNHHNTDNGLVLDIKNSLEDNGYEVFTNYGTSQFKIPLAVKLKNDKNFLAAIMIDDKLALNRTASENNRLLEVLINRLGWKYYLIHTSLWWINKEYELNKLLDFLKTEEVTRETTLDHSLLEVCESVSLEEKLFDKYEMVDINESINDYYNYSLEYAINKILVKEAPISEVELYRRVSKILGKNAVTSVVKNLTNKALPSDVTKNRGFYWQSYNEYPPFRISSDRTIDNICLEELASGIYTIVSYAVSIPVNECYKKLIEFLGYSRVTETTKKRLDDALMLLKIDGKVILTGDIISL